MECDFAIALPYRLRLQDNTGIVEDLLLKAILLDYKVLGGLSYGPPWAHYLGGYQDRLLGGSLGLPDLCRTIPVGVRRKDYGGEVLG
jgi:hypothetical protein